MAKVEINPEYQKEIEEAKRKKAAPEVEIETLEPPPPRPEGDKTFFEVLLEEEPAEVAEREAAAPATPEVAQALKQGAVAEAEERAGALSPERQDEAVARLTLLGIENPEAYAQKRQNY